MCHSSPISCLLERLLWTKVFFLCGWFGNSEAERERQRADTEKKKTEAEKLLREKLEKENATVKEQLVQVLQRLGRVEERQTAGQEEVARIRSEVWCWLSGPVCSCPMFGFYAGGLMWYHGRVMQSTLVGYARVLWNACWFHADYLQTIIKEIMVYQVSDLVV